MDKIKILWADDEIDMLKPQLFFLEKKGYDVLTVSNGHDAIDLFQEENIDIVFLDESMPGITGLETLHKIKEINGNIPVVMITKNEEEDIMEQAIGSQIDDYLIKPVNPNQILLTLKKIIDNKRLVSEKNISDYQQEFRNLLMEINSGPNYEEWVQVYKKILSWELKLDESNNEDMSDILQTQKNEANSEFSKYINKNYPSWLENEEGPTMSHQIMMSKILPNLATDKPNVILLLDNLRFDQWKMLEDIFIQSFRILKEDYFYSILPTATQYSRNAIFSGLLPSYIQKRFPDKWLNDNQPGGKNNHEKFFLDDLLKRVVRREMKMDYIKVTNVQKAKQLADTANNFYQNDLSVIVYNFIDMLSHARTEMEVLKELAGDEKAYRSLTRSWFLNSGLWTTLQKLAEKPIKLFVTTDHGTIRVKQASKVIGDKETSTNLRYKVGRNLNYNKKDVLEIRDPKKAGLPSPNMTSSFIFAKEDKFFVYPNNFNHYNNMFKDTFQHGGISLEEMLCPIITMESK
jgi:CheY-like chemotaxis protein